MRSKGPQDVVSEADFAVEGLIKQRLAEAFPEDAFFGEETGYTQVAGAGASGWSIRSTARSPSCRG